MSDYTDTQREIMEQAYRAHDDDPASSPEQTTEADVLVRIQILFASDPGTWTHRYPPDQLEVTIDGAVFQINVNRVR